MFLRNALVTFLTLATTPAYALCTGESYFDQLSTQEQTEVVDNAANIPFGQGLLWDATKDDKYLTIIGTMHIYDARLEPLRDSVSDVIANSDLLLVEATAEDEANLQALIADDPGLLFITDGPTLPELLDEETWALITDAANTRTIPAILAAKMQPWYLSLMLSIPACAMQDMVAGDRGLDHMLMQDAADAGVPMRALEPYTTLFDTFKDWPLEDQIDMLRANLGSAGEQQQMFVAMLDSYFKQNNAELWELTRISMTKAPDISPQNAEQLFTETEQDLLITRNLNWMPEIDKAVAENDDIVIAVGAAHLIGEQGVLQLLQDDGWMLSRR